MGKISYLRPRRGDIRPVLMLLTSHRLDCFLLCIRCLERFTDLPLFKRIYVVANAVSPEHAAIIRHFADRRGNVSVVNCAPRGLLPAVHSAQNDILSRHIDDVVVKMDEDLFVTPHWLEHLIEGYLDHAGRDDVPLVMPLVPISPPGRHVLNRFLKLSYPSESSMYCGPPIEENWVYHRWMWEKLVSESLGEVYLHDGPPKYAYVGYLTINCVVYDRRILERILPLPLSPIRGQPTTDEKVINQALHADKKRVAVIGRSLVHHYSFSKCEDYLRSHVPLERVWRFMQSQGQPPAALRRPLPTPGGITLLRARG